MYSLKEDNGRIWKIVKECITIIKTCENKRVDKNDGRFEMEGFANVGIAQVYEGVLFGKP